LVQDREDLRLEDRIYGEDYRILDAY